MRSHIESVKLLTCRTIEDAQRPGVRLSLECVEEHVYLWSTVSVYVAAIRYSDRAFAVLVVSYQRFVVRTERVQRFFGTGFRKPVMAVYNVSFRCRDIEEEFRNTVTGHIMDADDLSGCLELPFIDGVELSIPDLKPDDPARSLQQKIIVAVVVDIDDEVIPALCRIEFADDDRAEPHGEERVELGAIRGEREQEREHDEKHTKFSLHFLYFQGIDLRRA